MKLEEAIALVTGANRGIGRAITHALADAGATVLAGGRAVDEHHDVGTHSRVRPVRLELSSQQTITESVDALAGTPIDILVNNAGQFEGGLLEEHEVPHIYELLQSTLVGPIHLTPLLLPAMLERGRGKIVNNASIVAHAPSPGVTVYAAAKAGLHGFTESLRRELDQTEITVLELITPGVDTDMMDRVQTQLAGHADTDGWDHVDPADWAHKVVQAITSDQDRAQPRRRRAAREAPADCAVGRRRPPRV